MYNIKEVRAKDGYILDDVPQTVTINAGQTVTLEFRNQPMGSLLIRKVCSVNPSVTLAGAEFKITYATAPSSATPTVFTAAMKTARFALRASSLEKASW